jgi:hypothetical protein
VVDDRAAAAVASHADTPVSAPDLATQLEQYRLALDAQFALLGRLRAIALHQQALASGDDMRALEAAADERDRLLAGVLEIEQQLQDVRALLASQRATVQRLPGFAEVAAIHKKVTDTVAEVLETDRDSIRALEQVMASRRLAAQALEHGESTLAAYSRLATQPPSATLVNRRG